MEISTDKTACQNEFSVMPGYPEGWEAALNNGLGSTCQHAASCSWFPLTLHFLCYAMPASCRGGVYFLYLKHTPDDNIRPFKTLSSMSHVSNTTNDALELTDWVGAC